MNHPHKQNPDRLAGLVYGAFIADALALGAHWIYDQDQLHATFGRVTDYLKPRPDSYHPHKEAGEQTHYGDQSLVLMESIASQGGFDAADFAKRWQAMWPDYNDYKDHATKDTLARLADGLPEDTAGSDSEELGGAARIAPLLAWTAGEPLEKVVAAARKQTSLTHTSEIALDSAEFFTWVVDALLEDQPMEAALAGAASRIYVALPAAEMLERAVTVRSLTSREAVKAMGLACPAAQGVPAMLALLLQHSGDPETAFEENVMAGGDSAARALVLGMVLGAQSGKQALPERWIAGLKCATRVEAFLGKLA